MVEHRTQIPRFDPDYMMLMERFDARGKEIERLTAELADTERHRTAANRAFEEADAERNRLRAALATLVECRDEASGKNFPELYTPWSYKVSKAWDDARAALAGATDETSAGPSPNCGVTKVEDGYEASMRVDVTSDDPAIINAALMKLGELVLDACIDNTMVTVTHIPVATR